MIGDIIEIIVLLVFLIGLIVFARKALGAFGGTPSEKFKATLEKNEELSYGLIIVAGGIAAVVGFIMVFSKEHNTIGAFLTLFGIIFFIIGIKAQKGLKESEIGCYFIEKGTLVVKERKMDVGKIVTIMDDYNPVVKYEPEKLHIGAVTVGGITTGGTYTTGGNYYVAGKEKTGHYRLVCKDNTIYKIQLSDEQFKLAQKSRINKYLNEEKKQIMVVDEVSLTASEMIEYVATAKSSGYLTGGEVGKKGFPSYEKCREILSWLCGCN
ncbi:MAG: hypothetical protein II881_09370 [Oscillospiraceae bacterium]|nr:hypothetical protein [Oscillospiraceae bacterium]